MFFKSSYRVMGLLMKLGCDAIEFPFDPGRRTVATLRRVNSEPSTKYGGDHLTCDVATEQDVEPAVLSMFGSLSRREIPKGVSRRSLSPGALDKDGKISSLGLVVDAMPEPFDKAWSGVLFSMTDCATRVVSTIRWRLNRPQDAVPVSMDALSTAFSLDNESWHHLPAMGEAVLLFDQKEIALTPPIKDELVAMVEKKQTEPLAYNLFREAWSLRLRNQKSSLLIGFTAAEIGVKQYISLVVPHTKYLITNLPSPPLDRLLAYLGEIPSKTASQETKMVLPKSTRKHLEKMMKMRNEVAHRGKPDKGDHALSIYDLEDQLYAVRDLLWLLDYHAGFEWAIEHVRSEARRELGL